MTTLISDLVSPGVLQTLRVFSPALPQREEVTTAAKALIDSIRRVDLYHDWTALLARFQALRGEHPQVFSHRTDYFWKWIQVAFQIQTFRIPPEHFIASNSLKCRSAAIAIILDDICDNTKDENLFESCIASLQVRNLDELDNLRETLHRAWLSIRKDFASGHNYAILQEEINRAYEMLFAGFRHTLFTLKRRTAIHWHDFYEKIPHTTHVYLAGLIDLLFVPDWAQHHLENYKKVFLSTQKMAQIGNWVATWEREVEQNDFSSGAAWLAREKGLIDASEGNPEMLIKRIKRAGIEKHLLQQWEAIRKECYQIEDGFMKDYVDGFSIILAMQLAGRGLI